MYRIGYEPIDVTLTQPVQPHTEYNMPPRELLRRSRVLIASIPASRASHSWVVGHVDASRLGVNLLGVDSTHMT